jgi:hypothetical protein
MIYIKLVLVIWIFTYKTDTNDYLIKFKARFYIQGDL